MLLSFRLFTNQNNLWDLFVRSQCRHLCQKDRQQKKNTQTKKKRAKKSTKKQESEELSKLESKKRKLSKTKKIPLRFLKDWTKLKKSTINNKKKEQLDTLCSDNSGAMHNVRCDGKDKHKTQLFSLHRSETGVRCFSVC